MPLNDTQYVKIKPTVLDATQTTAEKFIHCHVHSLMEQQVIQSYMVNHN